MTENENIKNIMRCPRYEECDIPKCPLDLYMSERVELPEEKRCPLIRLCGKTKSKRTTDILSGKMKSLYKYIPEKNKR